MSTRSAITLSVTLLGAALVAACAAPASAPPTTTPPTVTQTSESEPGVTPALTFEVLEERPHDPTAFTQGLELVDGVLYEGTGLLGQSEIRATDPTTGSVSRRTPLSGEFFGEGITVVGDRIWQITWQNHVAMLRDKATFDEIKRVEYDTEGWGLCHDGSRLVMSDGSSTLTFRDPQTFAATGKVEVVADSGPVTRLNELECVKGAVYANVWQTDLIVRIDPATGRVTGRADLGGLLKDRAGADVLNGIAAIPGTDEFLVTGKLWPKMFRIRFAEHP